jgi:hypothetical protein
MLFILTCLPAAPLVAQTQIGGGTCNSSTVSGIYAFSITGRQVTSAGTLSNVIQGNGSANFDGQSKVTITMTTDNIAAPGTPTTWTGNYTLQANCVGVITITSGGNATLNLALYGTGSSGTAPTFLVSGNDATYNYSGSGNTQPSGCSAATLTGVYTFTGTGYGISGASVSGAENGTGLLQFDGVSSLTVNFNTSVLGKTPSPLTLTGSYSISSTCVGSATLTDSTKTNNYVMAFSITNSSTANGAFDATLAQSGKLLIGGTGNVAYGQPTPAASNQGEGNKPAAEFLAKLTSETVTRSTI